MFQLVYISTARACVVASELQSILSQSRRNNSLNGITGLLFFDGKRFLQAIEGEQDKVEEIFARITEDPRHRAVVVLSTRTTEAREFGDWAMACRMTVDGEDDMLGIVRSLVRDASPAVQATFNSFAKLRRAA